MWNQIGQSRPAAVNEIKIFDNDDKASKCSFSLRVFCGLIIIIKILISSTAGGLGCLIWFHIFLILALFSSWPLLFTPEVFWLRFNYTKEMMTFRLWNHYFWLPLFVAKLCSEHEFKGSVCLKIISFLNLDWIS